MVPDGGRRRSMVMCAGRADSAKLRVHGDRAVGGEKRVRTRPSRIAPAGLVAAFGVDGYRDQCLGDNSFDPDGDFSYEGMVARFNSGLANNLYRQFVGGNFLCRLAG